MYNGRECFLCGRNGSGDPLDRHHVFGGGLRKKSEKYGLVVDLCHHECHQYGRMAAHQSAQTRDELHRWAQKKAMRENNWTVSEFVAEFGKNYLDDDELEELYETDLEPEHYRDFFITAAVLPY